MAFNIIELSKEYLTGSVVDELASVVGSDSASVGAGLTGAIPSVMSGILNMGSSESGLTSLMGIINKDSSDNLLSNLSSTLGDSGKTSTLLNIGTSILGSVFGNNLGMVQSAISNFSGLSGSSSGSLLQFAAPFLISIIGKKVKSDGLGISGLGDLLSSQKSIVEKAMPSGLSSMLNFSAPDVKGAVKNVSSEVSKVSNNKWWPYLIGALLIFGAMWLWRNCKGDVKNATDAVTDTATAVGDAATDVAGDAASAVGDGVNALGDFLKRKLPNGIELNIPKNGVENKLIDAIESSNPVSKESWINFDRINFASGSSTLTEESAEQVKNIAEILKAYPNAKIKVGGYTDNTGSASANLKLSAERAKNVASALVAQGVDASRIASEGYGDAHPVASNDTPEGQAQNRRIAVNITEK